MVRAQDLVVRDEPGPTIAEPELTVPPVRIRRPSGPPALGTVGIQAVPAGEPHELLVHEAVADARGVPLQAVEQGVRGVRAETARQVPDAGEVAHAPARQGEADGVGGREGLGDEEYELGWE